MFSFNIFLSLKRHYNAIDTLAGHGLVFWDYGNAFLLEVSRAMENESEMKTKVSSTRFKYP